MRIAIELFLGVVLVASALGVILFRRPVYAALSFLMTLLALASFYLMLSAQFISVIQVLVYAGAILVLFMFVIMLFQDAHEEIGKFPARSSKVFLVFSGVAFLLGLAALALQLFGVSVGGKTGLPADFGTVQSLGKALYLDFSFPFEAVTLLFLVAVVGAVYIGKKERG